MELQLVTFEQAKALKELGFDEYLDIYYDIDNCLNSCYSDEAKPRKYDAPTLELVAKWLREEKEIFICPHKATKVSKAVCTIYYPVNTNIHTEYEIFDDYDEALSWGIDKAIEILKNGR